MTSRPSRNIPHPLVKKILAKFSGSTPPLVALLEEISRASDFDLDAMRESLTEMISASDREQGLYQRQLSEHARTHEDPERLAAEANAKWWEDDNAARIADIEAKLQACDDALDEHDVFVKGAPKLLAAAESDRYAVEILRAQLAAVQTALTKAEAKLEAHTATVHRYEHQAEQYQLLLSARLQFAKLVELRRAQINPHLEALEAFTHVDPPAPPPAPAHDPKLVAALLDTISDMT